MANMMGELLMVPVSVTPIDIRRGKKGDPRDCAIARALKRRFHTDDVSVYGDMAEIRGRTFYLPHEANEFVAQFDRADGPSPDPFTFNIGPETGTEEDAEYREVEYPRN